MRAVARWQQLLLIVAGVAVTAAMVIVAEIARERADSHRRAQVLVETIRSSSQELNAIRAEALVGALAARQTHVRLSRGIVQSGFHAWSELAGSLAQLRRLEPDAHTATLQRDAEALYLIGLHTLASAGERALPQALHDERVHFQPALDRLNADAVRASAAERAVADRASSNSEAAFFASIAVGLVALALITWRFGRLRRQAMLDDALRQVLEDDLRHRASHDSLTGLANRTLFEERLSHALAHATERGRAFAVLFLDLDDFKTINDSLGHARGDDLLRAVASRISGSIRPSDTAARLGGDEFALLIEVVGSEDDARVVARRVLGALALPFSIGGTELYVTASVGVALWAGANGVEDLLRNADEAMYAAKAAGKASIRTFGGERAPRAAA